MIKKIIILGSTGSIGTSALNCLKNSNDYKVELLSTNKNVKKILDQAILFNVKNVIIEDKDSFIKFREKFKRHNIFLHHGLININKIIKKKVNYCINSISGLSGLEPTLKVIPLTKNILIANKESIICGWDLIFNQLKKYKTNFIPLDSEHFSIWNLIKNENHNEIQRIVLTASGGPFLNMSSKKLANIKPKFALKHPNWKMGKKISIDSSTMMNKIFELIEAKKIFNLRNKDVSIILQPSSFVHAIVFFRGNLIKLLAHDTKMSIPISNALNIKKLFTNKNILKSFDKFNNLKFLYPSKKNYPLISIIDLIPEKSSYFETILITLNDVLVEKYLHNEINYKSIHKNLLKLLKSPYFIKFYKLKPKNIYDIKKMITIINKYIKDKIKYYA